MYYEQLSGGISAVRERFRQGGLDKTFPSGLQSQCDAALTFFSKPANFGKESVTKLEGLGVP